MKSKGKQATAALKKKELPALSNVSAVIIMSPADTSVTNALATCIAARVHVVYVVDQTRGEEVYEKEPLIQMARNKGTKVEFVACDGNDEEQLSLHVYSQMPRDNMFLSIPPDFHATGEQTHALLNRARNSWKHYKRFAVAPTYVAHEGQGFQFWGALSLMFHVFWSLLSIFYRGRLYRGTYMQAVVLKREQETVQLPDARFGFGERAPFIYGGGGARSRPPLDRSAMEHFLYNVTRESFNSNTWIALLAYVIVFSLPYSILAQGGPRLLVRFCLTDSFFIFKMVIHFLITMFFANKYFSSIWHSLIHALLAPALMPILVIMVFYAKVIWKGYGGDLPVLRFPDVHTVPLFTDYIKTLGITGSDQPGSSSSSDAKHNTNNGDGEHDVAQEEEGGVEEEMGQ